LRERAHQNSDLGRPGHRERCFHQHDLGNHADHLSDLAGGSPEKLIVRQPFEGLLLDAPQDETHRGGHRVAGQHRHRIVQVVASNFERMSRPSIQGKTHYGRYGSIRDH
jgi:hypothetical protein